MMPATQRHALPLYRSALRERLDVVRLDSIGRPAHRAASASLSEHAPPESGLRSGAATDAVVWAAPAASVLSR